MPFIHPSSHKNVTALLQQFEQRIKRPAAASPLHIMDVRALESPSLRDELRLHARYIRDTLVPLLSRQPRATHSDRVLLRSIFRKLESTHVTLDLLRYSRMEKALMVIAATGAATWPMEVVVQAENLIQKWEDELGPLKNLRSDLYGPGGRLEGVRKIIDGDKGGGHGDDDAKSAWSVDVLNPFQSHRHGSLGFEVGDWWLKPAAAYRDGIIDKTAHAITADDNAAYAIVVSGSSEQALRADGQFIYRAALHDPGVFKLTKTMTTNTEKTVRVLRSWKLRSDLAPKAGLRYDGMYRIRSYGVKLEPPNSWHTTFTLSRLPDQPPIATALAYPMSDQLDDWRDYQRLKNVDRGEDFAVLREILRGPHADSKIEIFNDDEDGEDMKRDSGYFSRRSSKTSSRVNSMPLDLPESTLENVPESACELEFTLVAEGTPSTPDSETQHLDGENPTIGLAAQSMKDGSHTFFDPRKPKSTVDSPGNNFDPDLRHIDRVVTGQTQERSDKIIRDADEAGIHRSENPKDWPYQQDTWGLDGVEQDDLPESASRRAVKGMAELDLNDESDEDQTIFRGEWDLKGSSNRQAVALKQMKRWTFKKRSVDETLARRAIWDGTADTVDAGEEAAKRRSFAIRSK